MTSDDLSGDMIRQHALDWAVRTGDSAFEDWDSFTLWLEQSPAHALAYDAACASVADGADLLAEAAPANDDESFQGLAGNDGAAISRRSWFRGAIAASVALAAGVAFWQGSNGRDLYRIETAPGQLRMIVLEDGSRIDLAGGSALELDREDQRYARLASGQALFTVRHDEADPFQVDAGRDTLVDIGTVFDVRYDKLGLSVAVSEGAVAYNPDEQNVRVLPGQVLRTGKDDKYVLGQVAPEQVGEWRDGRLTFSDSPLGQVAADLSRATGTHYSVARGEMTRTVSGSVLLAPIQNDPTAIGALLGLSVRPNGDQWVLGED